MEKVSIIFSAHFFPPNGAIVNTLLVTFCRMTVLMLLPLGFEIP